MLPAPSSAERATYYLTALRLLRLVEERSPTKRRFGADADALWKDFAGGLKTSDRIDVLLRDADTEWPGAFGARATFGLRAVAEDDAFGADWASLPPMDGERIWKDAMKAGLPDGLEAALEQICTAWELQPQSFTMPRMTATSRALVGGASAIVQAVRTFADNTSLSWSNQLVIVADRPGERQLAAAAAMLLKSTHGTVIRGSSDHVGDPKPPKLSGHLAIVSSDATAEVRRGIEELAK